MLHDAHEDGLNKTELLNLDFSTLFDLIKQQAGVIIRSIFITAWNDSSEITGVIPVDVC